MPNIDDLVKHHQDLKVARKREAHFKSLAAKEAEKIQTAINSIKSINARLIMGDRA